MKHQRVNTLAHDFFCIAHDEMPFITHEILKYSIPNAKSLKYQSARGCTCSSPSISNLLTTTYRLFCLSRVY